MCLSLLAYRYIQAILSRSVNGYGDSTKVLSRQALLYLYSIVHSEPLHLRHILVEYLRHQGEYARIGVIFSKPYITRLITGMGLLDVIRRAENIIVSSPLSIKTMRLMAWFVDIDQEFT